MRHILSGLAIFALILSLASTASAQSTSLLSNEEITGVVVVVDTPVNMSFQTAPNKRVGVDARESISIRNTTSVNLSGGVLEVQFPAELTLVSATPAQSSMVTNRATWSVPVLSPGATFTVSFTVRPVQTDALIVTSARYIVPGMEEGFISGGEFITAGQVAGAIAGTTDVGGTAAVDTLPRTGSEAGFAISVLTLLALAVFLRQDFKFAN